ncbi:hypothetical protein [Natrononativus amylolyticus]|uniref:hypothetical protein n=1 Tax=Natrononativus amylolyticus TaxID=2963434 RepID=UPI0020CCF6B3|nr:hypothetical protein [Natrononativus amylolyticus]
MGISDLLSGLWHEDETATERSESATQRRPPQSADTVVYECRYCGTTVSGTTVRCPTCESDEIATYPIE